MITKILIPFLISINLFALSEENQKAMEKKRDEIYRMVDYGKTLINEAKQIQSACKLLKKFMAKKECPEYSKQIQEKLDSLENSLVEQKHAFFAHLKGAVIFGRKCGTCDNAAQQKYCPKMDKVISHYDYLK